MRWLEHPGLRHVLAWSWPVAAGLGLASYGTGWIWRNDWLGMAIPAVPLAVWLAVGATGWARGGGAAVPSVARAWLLGHVGAAVAIEAVNLALGESLLLVSRDWPPLSASVGGLGAFYLMGTSFIVPWGHCFVASALVGFRRTALSPGWEWGLAAALAGWLGAGGVASLLMSAA